MAFVRDSEVIPALELLQRYLREQRALRAYAPDMEDGFQFGYNDETGCWTCESSPMADVAREWCRGLLKAADANGADGRKLCQG